jgi:hypothetical protein
MKPITIPKTKIGNQPAPFTDHRGRPSFVPPPRCVHGLDPFTCGQCETNRSFNR